ncbi:penicillin-binding transpeptidase domain-containing protein [Desulforapulum autotrophicum]|uniref:penicillin-binding transpeptidase domain-containing protein n=1 Tax=Desulforapulum autotrophicum TaxID=2296 RepID=UPI001E4DAD2E|nr:penicillin-binding transpeptidase domain-containing protein [Desulforapulum autotrophicum]
MIKFFSLVLITAGIIVAIDIVSLESLPEIVATVKNHLPMEKTQPADLIDSPGEKSEKTTQQTPMTKQDLRALLNPSLIFNTETSKIMIQGTTEKFFVETSLDPSLQRLLTRNLDELKTLTRGKPQRIGLVAMEPFSGKIVAMAGFDLGNPSANPCTMDDYPAASIFKIVTASAVVETIGYSPETPLYFNGGKYTLYKRQLKETQNRYTTRVTLAKAFAESINPIFGKIAATRLDPETLTLYARAFGFNQAMDSDFSFDSGKMLITDSTYQQAEVGCGFNKTTTISPMFGAMLSSTIVNQGNRIVPSVVERVTDTKGTVVYASAPPHTQRAVNSKTARAVRTMMSRTITQGTARKAFRGAQRDSTLSKLEIGGKTGSINSRDNTIRYDWFTGFAKEKNGEKALALAVVVGHRKYIGTRASTYGKMIFKHYFNAYFASNKTTANRG